VDVIGPRRGASATALQPFVALGFIETEVVSDIPAGPNYTSHVPGVVFFGKYDSFTQLEYDISNANFGSLRFQERCRLGSQVPCIANLLLELTEDCSP